MVNTLNRLLNAMHPCNPISMHLPKKKQEQLISSHWQSPATAPVLGDTLEF